MNYPGVTPLVSRYLITVSPFWTLNLARIWQWWTEANNFGSCISRFAALAV
ncbi:hypothetical protein AB0758_47470 [Tolypothrix bouteillei VB521301_2]